MMGFLSLFSATRVSNPVFDRIFTFSDDILLQRCVHVVKTDRRRRNRIRFFLAAQVYIRDERPRVTTAAMVLNEYEIDRERCRSLAVVRAASTGSDSTLASSFVVTKPQTYVIHSPPRMFECQLNT